MHGSKNRSILQVEVMESKLVLSALAPVAAMRAASPPVADVERAVAPAAVMAKSDTNLVVIKNNTDKQIRVFANLPPKGGYLKEDIDWRIPRGDSHSFEFKPPVPGFITVRIVAEPKGPPPEFKTTLSAAGLGGGYYGKTFTVSTLGDRFTVS